MRGHEHALRAVQVGGAIPLDVFPLIEQQKTPAIVGWQTSASHDPATIAQMWNADMGEQWAHQYNVGIRTGDYSRGGDPRHLLVVDVDNKNGKKGSESVFALEMQGVELPATYTQHTPSGGLHYFFWSPAPLRNMVDRDGKGSIARGIDIRCDGGLVVASGSVTEVGEYTDNGAPIADAPAALIDRILSAGGAPIERSTATAPESINQERARSRAVEYLRHAAPEAIEGSGGDATTFKVAAQLKDIGVPEADALDLMMSHWFDGCGWSADELAEKIGNAYRYGKNAPGIASPEAQFQPVSVAPEPPIFTLESAQAGRFLACDPPAMRWCAEPFIPAGRPAGLVAAGGTGKSLLSIQLAIAKATGRPFLDRYDLAPGGVLVVALEDDESELHRRIFRVARAQGIGADELHRFFAISRVGDNSKLIDGRSGELLQTMFARQLAEAARQISELSLIVLDPASRLRSGDENAASDATALIEAVERVALATGAAVLVVHHTPKSAAAARDVTATAARGSSAFTDGLRSQIVLRTMTPDEARRRGVSRERAANLVEMVLAKANYSAPVPPIWLQRGGSGLLSIVDLDAEAAMRDESPDDAYIEVLDKVRAHLTDGRIESRRSLEREHGGKDGKFSISAPRLRAILSRAVDAGHLIEQPGTRGGKAQTVLALPLEEPT